MELPQKNQKLIKVMPHRKKIQENSHMMKHKPNQKLNVSDYIVEKKKKLSKKLSQHFGDLLINFNEKITLIKKKYMLEEALLSQDQK